MSLDQLFVDVGEHVDRCINVARHDIHVLPTRRPPRRTVAIVAAAAVVLLGLAGFVAIVTRSRDEPAPQQPANPGGPSLFDGGVDMLVFVRPRASDEQVASIRTALLEEQTLLDPAQVQYLGYTESLEEARRLFADDPSTLALFNADNLPTTFHLRRLPGVTDAQLDALVPELAKLPMVQMVSTPRTRFPPGGPPAEPVSSGAPFSTQTTLAPLG